MTVCAAQRKCVRRAEVTGRVQSAGNFTRNLRWRNFVKLPVK